MILSPQLFIDQLDMLKSWVSNGHFAIKWDQVDNPQAIILSCNEDTAVNDWRHTDAPVNKLLGATFENSRQFVVTSTMAPCVNPDLPHVVRLVSGCEFAFISSLYIDTFGLKTGDLLFSQGPSCPFFNSRTKEEVTLVLMGVRQ